MHRGPKLIKLAAASLNHGNGALFRPIDVMDTPAGSHSVKAYAEIDRARETSAIIKKTEWSKKAMSLRRTERRKKLLTAEERRDHVPGGRVRRRDRSDISIEIKATKRNKKRNERRTMNRNEENTKKRDRRGKEWRA